MKSALAIIREQVRSAPERERDSILALLTVVDAALAHGHPITCKGCRLVLETLRPLAREVPDMGVDLPAPIPMRGRKRKAALGA